MRCSRGSESQQGRPPARDAPVRAPLTISMPIAAQIIAGSGPHRKCRNCITGGATLKCQSKLSQTQCKVCARLTCSLEGGDTMSTSLGPY